MTDNLFVEMDPDHLRTGSKLLRDLARVYCDLWRYDENFQEYMQCPSCKKYFGESVVKFDGVSTCDDEHSEVDLVAAWNEAEVEQTLVKDMLKPGFVGWISIGRDKDVQGFAWALRLPLWHFRRVWGDKLVGMLSRPTEFIMYFDELGVRGDCRGHGIGTRLARIVLEQMKAQNPASMTTLLRTHKDSPARGIYRVSGYKVVGEDTQYGDGRIMMCTTLVNVDTTKLRH